MKAEATALITDTTYCLIKSHLWDRAPEEISFKLNDNQWEQVLALCREQGVLALSYQTICNLKPQSRPNFDIEIKWGVNALNISTVFYNQLKALNKYNSRLPEAASCPLVLKGFGLALLYPIPKLRECGDVDIYLFNNFNIGNKTAHELGTDVFYGYHKHTKFLIDSIVFENHCSLFDGFDKKTVELENYLIKNIQVNKSNLLGTNFLTPDFNFNYIYLIKHASNHFITHGIYLRHICDWALFLKKYDTIIDYKRCNKILSDNNLLKFTKLLTLFSCSYLDLEIQNSPFIHYKISWKSKRLLKRLHKDIFSLGISPFNRTINSAALRPKPTRFSKIKKVISSRWKYDIFDKTRFFKELYHAIRGEY